MAGRMAAVLAGLAIALAGSAGAAEIEEGEVVPVRFYCVAAEPVLDMLALDAAGDVAGSIARFDEAAEAGACVLLDAPLPGRALELLAEAVTSSSGPVEVWSIELGLAPASVYAGFASRAFADIDQETE